eukprot:TRINITY_DN1098_c0_g2_i4.p1 TRINITY_DN1098_c0_g2~~TRINITY_DN1098_c0_g2_i4.p1  ORF type:complete len:126 (-),score=3.20 TRINITY_DN1098_c0_g2_i4:329-706(-)
MKEGREGLNRNNVSNEFIEVVRCHTLCGVKKERERIVGSFVNWFLTRYGMMHAVTLVSDDNHDDGGKASYRNRFVDSKMKRNKGNKGGFDMHFGALFSSYRFIVVTFYNAVVMVKRRLFGQVIKG